MLIGICDNERSSACRVRELVLNTCVDMNMEAQLQVCYKNASIGELPAKAEQVDLLLINADMAGVDPFQLGKSVYEVNPMCFIGYYTRGSFCMSAAFASRPYAYVTEADRGEALKHAIGQLIREVCVRGCMLCLKNKAEVLSLPVLSIEYCESNYKQIILHTQQRREYRFFMKLDELEKMLPKGQFVRCHKSYLVNLAFIRRVDKARRSLLLACGEEIAVSKSSYALTLGQIDNYCCKSAKNTVGHPLAAAELTMGVRSGG